MSVKTLYIIILFTLFSWRISAQSGSVPAVETFQKSIYEAYVTGNMVLWEQTLKEMEKLYALTPANSVLYDIILAQYGLIGYYLGLDQNSKAAHHLDRAEENLKRLSKVRAYHTTSLVFESAFLAFRISLRPIRAVQLGPRSYRLIDQAEASDPSYSRVWIEKGNAAFYTPPVFGGNRSDAIVYYQKAIDLLEKNMPGNHRWLYLSTLMALANVYEKTGDLQRAIRTTEKALSFEPRFKWARDEILPKYRAMMRR
jgi:tetratricopeptide (TPR) repeat protein